MKFKRLLAAILSAMMVMSCFSFVASAQETEQTVTNPVATVQTAKANHATYRHDNGTPGLTKAKFFDAVNDKIFYRFVTDKTGGTATTKLDAYGLPDIKVTNGKVYMAMEVRTNYAVKPYVVTYNTVDIDDNKTNSAVQGKTYTAASSAKGNGEWERLVIEISNEKLAKFTQVHFFLFGSEYNTATKSPRDAYMDISAFGFFNDQYSALNYDFTSLVNTGTKASWSVDGVVTETVPEVTAPEGMLFAGWSSDVDAENGTQATEFPEVPENDTTYYAIFTDKVEEDNTIYVSADGSDDNGGQHSKDAFATMQKAYEVITADTENYYKNIVIVGSVSYVPVTNGKTYLGANDKTLTIKGYDGNANLQIERYRTEFRGNITVKNLAVNAIVSSGAEVPFAHINANVTLGNGAKLTKNGAAYGFTAADYADPSGSTLNQTFIYDTGIADKNFVYVVSGYAGESKNGTVKFVLNSGVVSALRLTKGATNNAATGSALNNRFSGIAEYEINGGSADSLDFGTGGGLKGLAYATINGGTVGTIYTTQKNRGSANWKASETSLVVPSSLVGEIAGVSVFEINGGTVNTIKRYDGSDNSQATAANKVDKVNYDDAWTEMARVVIFNDGVAAKNVADDDAIVLDVNGGSLSAVATPATEGGYDYKLDGFEFRDIGKSTFVKISKAGSEEAENLNITDLVDGVIPASYFAKGVNTVEFCKDPAVLEYYENYEGGKTEAWVTKEVPCGATVDILPLESDVKGTAHATQSNDIVTRPARPGYKLLGWSTDKNATVPETVVALRDTKYYAVWEEIPEENLLTAGDDFELTIVDGETVTASPVPENAISFIRGDEKNSFATNSNGVKYYDTTITDISEYGVSYVSGKTGIGSWYGGADAQKTILCPNGTKSIWYKWNDSYISAKPGVEGEYYVSYWIYTGDAGTTRAFTLDAPGKSGVVYLDGAGNKDHFVTFKANLTEDSELKYSAALDFDNNSVKGAQLLGIYVWKTEKQALTEKYPDYNIYFVTGNGAGNKNGSTPEDAYALNRLNANNQPYCTLGYNTTASSKVVYAFIDNAFTVANLTLGLGDNQEVILTSGDGTPFHCGNHINFTKDKNAKVTFENIEFVHGGVYTMETGSVPQAGSKTDAAERYISACGNDIVIGEGFIATPVTYNGVTRTGTLHIQPGGDGNSYTSADNVKFELYSGTHITVRAGGYGGTALNHGIDYIIGGTAQIANVSGNIQASGTTAQKKYSQANFDKITDKPTVVVDNTDSKKKLWKNTTNYYKYDGSNYLTYDLDGIPVSTKTKGERTISGDISILVKDNAKITNLNTVGRGIIAGDVYFTVEGNANVGTIESVADGNTKIYYAIDTATGEYLDKNNDGKIDNNDKVTTLGTDGKLEGDVIIHINGGTVGTVKGTAGKSRNLIVNLNKAVIPQYLGGLTRTVTYTGDGEVALDLSGETAKLTLVPGANAKYVRVTLADGTKKEFKADGSDVNLLSEGIVVDIVDGTTAVEFLADATEGASVTFKADGGTFANGTDTLTAVLAIGSAVTNTTVEVPTKSKAIFAGWTPADVTVADGAVYTATWTDAYDIKIVVNGEETVNQYVKDAVVSFPEITIGKDEKKVFLGWSTVSATTKENLITDTSAITATEDKTYYAVIANYPIVTYQWAGYEHTKQYEYGAKVDFFPINMADKNYKYAFIGWKVGENIYTKDTVPALTEDVTYVGQFSTEGVAITKDSATRLFDTMNLEQVNQGTYGKRFIQTKGQTIDGIAASMITPNAELVSTSNGPISIEGAGYYPFNNSYGNDSGAINPNTYPYIAVKYYYVPGTATAERTMKIMVQKDPYMTNPGTFGGELTTKMVPGKWTYAIYTIPEGRQPSTQYHLRPFDLINLDVLNESGEAVYLHSISIFKEQPVLSTVTFESEDGTALYTIDALNTDVVTYYGAEQSKEGYTFMGWAKKGTTEVVEALTFAEDTTLVPVFAQVANAVFDANDGKFANGEDTVIVETAVGEVPAAPEAPEKYGFVFSGWSPELKEMDADGETYTATWVAQQVQTPKLLRTMRISGSWDSFFNGNKDGLNVNHRSDEINNKWFVKYTPTKSGGNVVPHEAANQNVAVTNGKIYIAMDVRTNISVTPAVQLRKYTVNIDGVETDTPEANKTYFAEATLGNETWERVVIAVELDGLTHITTNTNHFFAWAEIVSGTTYMDVLGVAYFDDLYSAENYVFDVLPTKAINFDVDGTVTELAPADVPSKTGYTFKGWSTAQDGAADIVAHSALTNLPHEDATYYAIFEADKYEITFNAGEGSFADASKEKKVQTAYDTIPTAPETPVLEGYEFKGWTPELAKVTGPATYTAVFEKIAAEETFPTTPTYKTYGTYNAANEVYSVELTLAGTKANIGSFGFAFPKEYMTLTKVTANAQAGVVLFAEEVSEQAQPSPIFVKDTENGYYANTWTAELAEGYGYVDATTEEVLIATFEFTMTGAQRTAFEEVLGESYKFDEYVVTNADAKYHNGTNYLVAPYTPDLATDKEAVVYASHSDVVEEVETVSIALKVNFIEHKGEEGTSLATVRVDDGAATVIEAANSTGSATYTIGNLTEGQTYKIYVEKNGYIAGICEVTVNAGTNALEMTLIAGDIKGEKDAVCGDGEVNLDDFVRLIRAFDPTSSIDFRNATDIDEDGSVTVSDLGYIKTNYSKTYKDVAITFNGESVIPGITE